MPSASAFPKAASAGFSANPAPARPACSACSLSPPSPPTAASPCSAKTSAAPAAPTCPRSAAASASCSRISASSPNLSAYDNVALPLRIAGRPEGQIRVDVLELLGWVGLARKLKSRPAELSGGEQQRVAIARAVIGRPLLLLADEPTGNLDEVQAERLMRLLQELNRLGTTVVVATHNAALVHRHAGHTLRLHAGHLVRND